MSGPPKIPPHPPLHYVQGGWPGGTVRELSAEEGGELVRYQVEQIRQFVADMKKRREDRMLSQAAVARKTGLRRNTISDLEAGQSYPDWHTISRIAYALEADVRFADRRAVRVRLPQDR